MSEINILFEHIGPFKNTTVVCVECGSMICDWRRSGGEFTSERPNQDKHAAWHQSVQSDK